jgi:hypothetical protein
MPRPLNVLGQRWLGIQRARTRRSRELPAQWDEAAEGDMRYDIAEEQRLFPAPELAIPNLHPIGIQAAKLTAPEFTRPLTEVA